MRRLLLLVGLLATGCATPSARLDDEGRLLTAVVTLERDDGDVVVVAGTVHVASGAFFDAVTARLASCEVIVDESVEGAPVRDLYVQTAQRLHLVHQGEAMPRGWIPDARRVVTDPTFEELRVMAPRELGSSFQPEVQALILRTITRAAIAAQVTAGLAEEDAPVLLGVRNARAAAAVLEHLVRPGVSRVGVCYGSGHLPGIVGRLEDAGLDVTSVEWLEAFQCEPELRPR